MAAGGNNQRLTSPSCNPLRLAKHAANDRSNFHYCKTFIYELWSTDLFRKQTLFSICRCQSTQILKTVKSQKSSFDKMFKNCVSGLEMPQMPNIIFSQAFYKICCLQHICCVRPQSTVKEVERDLSSYNLYLLKKVVWCDAWHQRSEKLFPLQSRAPCPPFSGCNNPLCKFLCSTVTSTITFQPSTFTFRTFVWNRGTWNLPPTTPSSCLPL